jgi:hypothetical protein
MATGSVTGYSQSIIPTKYLYVPVGGVMQNINLNDSTSVNLIDRLNDYNYQNNIITSFKDLEDHFGDRIRFELHLGPGLLHRFKPNDPYRDSSYLFLSFKVNLINPKLPQPQYVINKAHAIKNYLAEHQYAYRDEMLQRTQAIEDAVTEYQRHFWWKRISFGVSVPVYSYRTNSSLEWYSDRAAVFAGYDIGDIGTFQLGVSTDKSIYTAFTFDVSTPLYLLSERAISTLTRILGVSRAGSYY